MNNYDSILCKDYGTLRLPTTDVEARTRVCRECGIRQPIRNYRQWGDGYRHVCKDCEKVQRIINQYNDL